MLFRSFNLRVIVLLGSIGGSDHMNDSIIPVVADQFGSQPHIMEHCVPVALACVRRDVEHAAVHENNDMASGVAQLRHLDKAVLKGGLQFDKILEEANVVDSTCYLATVIVRALHEARLRVGHHEYFEAHLEQDRKSTRLNSSHSQQSRMPSSA